MEYPRISLKKIQDYFLKSKENLGVAESLTGGLLSYWLSELPGSSKYFKGGVVSYQSAVKIELLGLSSESIKTEGLVTKEAAESMAQGVKKLLKSDWALSLTGVAGPGLGDLGEPVGKVAFSLISPKKSQSQVREFEGPDRQDIRHQSALFALDFLISELK